MCLPSVNFVMRDFNLPRCILACRHNVPINGKAGVDHEQSASCPDLHMGSQGVSKLLVVVIQLVDLEQRCHFFDLVKDPFKA